MSRVGRPLILLAASGLAREAAAAAMAAGRQVLGCLDDSPHLAGHDVSPGLPVLGTLGDIARFPAAEVVVCAGKGVVRARIVERLAGAGLTDDRYGSIIHPSVAVPSSCTLGGGSILLAGTVLTADVSVGRHVVCMPNAVLTHDCRVEDYVTVCAGVVLGGGVVLERAAYLGMGCAIRESRTVGAESVVGMGSVVLSDVPARQIWAGVPAKALPPPTDGG